jgi:hypothetical protein
MSDINSFGKTLAEMPVAAPITVVILAGFALAAFAIWVVVTNGRRPRA